MCLKEFSGDIIQIVLDCLYSNRVKSTAVTKENCKELLKAGEFFGIDLVKELAAMHMAKNLDEDNAIDLVSQDIFSGPVANNAFKFIGENFQIFMEKEELKKRLIQEANVDTVVNLLQQKYLMLWHPTGLYLNGIEREKKLFFFVMSYIAHDIDQRLPELARPLTALKLPLLAATKVLSVQVMGEGLKVNPEELSGRLA